MILCKQKKFKFKFKWSDKAKCEACRSKTFQITFTPGNTLNN